MTIDCSRAFDRGKNVQRDVKEPEEGGGRGRRKRREGEEEGRGDLNLCPHNVAAWLSL